MSLKHRIRRAAAGGGILVLALAGVLGSTSAASATGYPVVPDTNGKLTIHKHVKDDNSTPGNPAGAPLNGVGFSVQKVGKQNGAVCETINLTTPAGWESVTAALAAFDPASGALPAGFCADGAASTVTTQAPNGTAVIDPAKGFYLVTETTPGANLITEKASPFLVTVPMPVPGSAGAAGSWSFDVHTYPKNVLGSFTPVKTVAANNENSVVVPGAIVPWTIETTIPKAPFPYTTVKVTDTPAAGHVFKAWTEARLNGVLLNGPDAVLPDVPDYSVSGGELTLTAAGLAKVNAITGGANATLTVKLTTEVTATDMGAFANNANVTLNSTTVPVTPPQTNWGKLVITKHKAGNEQATIAGARFAVYPKTSAGAECVASDVAGTPAWSTPATPDPSAAVQSAVLWISNTALGAPIGSKDYCLKETQAPTGYVLDSTPRKVTISSTTAAAEYKFPNVEVPNPPLPLTGSTGAMAFGIVGFGLIGAAGALFAVRRSRAVKR